MSNGSLQALIQNGSHPVSGVVHLDFGQRLAGEVFGSHGYSLERT
jgi:hypothetical protein